MTRFARALAPFWLAASAEVVADDLAAQEPVRVSGEVVCGDCVITIDTVVTLGGLEGEGTESVLFHSNIAIGPGDRILVTEVRMSQIFVFDMAGTFLHTVGRAGEGPGEYLWITHVNVGPRYINVFDDRGRTLLDHDFAFVRRDRFPGQFHQSFMVDAEVVALAGSIPTPDAVGHELHLLAPSGELESYGAADSAYRTWVTTTHYLTGGGTSLWTVAQESTEVTRWDLLPSPAVGRIWDRTVDEWDRHDRGPTGFASPRPINTGAMLDEDGLWIIWRTPDPDWGGVPSEESRPVTGPRQAMWDSWLELIDPSSGKTLARHYDKGVFKTFANGSRSRYFYSYHETDAGVPYIHLLEPRLSRRAGGRR